MDYGFVSRGKRLAAGCTFTDVGLSRLVLTGRSDLESPLVNASSRVVAA